MKKELLLARIKETGLVAVVRAHDTNEAIKISEACLEGGIVAIELTFTVPFAHHVIEDLAKRYDADEIALGAGTVLDSETARIAILSGATYVVSPSFSADTMKLCNRYRIPMMPGVVTPAQAIEAMEAGADILKVFPGELFGPKLISALKSPLPQAQMMPTGGVDIANIKNWIEAGAVAVGVGSALTQGTHAEIVHAAQQFKRSIDEARVMKKATGKGRG